MSILSTMVKEFFDLIAANNADGVIKFLTSHQLASSNEEIICSPTSKASKFSINAKLEGVGKTALHIAASKGYFEICEILLANGALVDAVDSEGETALLKASYHGHYKVVQLLLGSGANYMHQEKDGWSALHNAASCGHLKIVQALLKSGIYPDIKSKSGKTPLMNASSKGFTGIVAYLLKKGANPCLSDLYDEYAYDMAASLLFYDICQMLLEAELRWCLALKLFQQPENMAIIEGFKLLNEQRLDVAYQYVASIAARHLISLPEHHVELELLYENQRSNMMGRFSAEHLQPHTIDKCGPWSDRNGSATNTTSDDFIRPPTSWFWLSTWVIDRQSANCDKDGWEYSSGWDDPIVSPTKVKLSDFSPTQIVALRIPVFHFLETKWQSFPTVGIFQSGVRRRRYLRARKKIPTFPINNLVSTVAADEKGKATAAASVEVEKKPISFWESICDSVFDGYLTRAYSHQPKPHPLNTASQQQNSAKLMRQGSEAVVYGYLIKAFDVLYRHEAKYLEKSGLIELANYKPNRQWKSSAESDDDPQLQTLEANVKDYESGIGILLKGFKGETDFFRKKMVGDFIDRLLIKLEKIKKSIASSPAKAKNTSEIGSIRPPESEHLQNITLTTMKAFEPLEETSATNFEAPEPQANSNAMTDQAPTPTPGMYSHTPSANEAVKRNSLINSDESIQELKKNLSMINNAHNMEDDDNESYLEKTSPRKFERTQTADSIDYFHSADQFLSEQSSNHGSRSGSMRLFRQTLEGDANVGVKDEDGNTLTEVEEKLIQQRHLGWARDDSVSACSLCSRKFITLFMRRHHCRWCGQVFCDRCSRGRVTGLLSEYYNCNEEKEEEQKEEVETPSAESSQNKAAALERLCVTCFNLWKLSGYMIDSTNPSSSSSDKLLGHIIVDRIFALRKEQQQGGGAAGAGGQGKKKKRTTSHNPDGKFSNFLDHLLGNLGKLKRPNASIKDHDSSSGADATGETASLLGPRSPNEQDQLTECPVCSYVFPNTMTDGEVENHVEGCLSDPNSRAHGHSIGNRYLTRELSDDIAERECVICYEPFLKGEKIAVMDCLCQFHEPCIEQWFWKGKGECPVHYD